MDFNFSPQDQAFREEFRRWLADNAPAGTRNTSDDLLGLDSDADWQERVSWHRRMHAAGWVAIHWPREYGGRGANLLQSLIYNEELAYSRTPALVNGLGIMLAGPTLMQWGTEEQKRRYIPKIAAAEEIWCQGYSEPNAGSDVASLTTRAEEDGDDFVVNGQKIWTSDARRADMCMLLTRTDPSAPKHRGISYLLVDMHSPGVTVHPLVQMTGEVGFGQVFFDNVRVPKRNLLGEKNQGWQVAITTLMFERSGIGSGRDLVGQSRELIDLARACRRQGEDAWADTGVRQRIAHFACEAQALRLTGYRQLTRRLKGLPPGPEGSVMKLGAAELNLKMTSYAMELMGPFGQLALQAPHAPAHGKWSHRMLAARALTIAGGTSEIQRNIIGERVLALPKG